MKNIIKEELSPLNSSVGQLKDSIKTLEESNRATLRNDLLVSYRHCSEKGYKTLEDMQNWAHMYEAYKQLNGNSFIDSLKVDFENLPNEEEFKKHTRF